MAWTQKLTDIFSRPDCARVLAEFGGDAGRARRVSVLLDNPAVHKNQEIAERIADNCEVLCFTKGHHFIEQGDISDDVFYLLAGEANILLNGEKITYREAPTQVGEMAARAQGKTRTASVSARTRLLVVARVKGQKFLEIEANYPEFRDRLSVELEARFRERLTAQKVYAENNSLIWPLISIAASIILGLLVWTFVAPDSWTLKARALASIAAGFTSFMIVLMRNPAFIWRHLAFFIGIATVGYVVMGRQVRLIADGTPFETVSFELISDTGDESWQTLFIKIGGMLLLFGIAAFMDWQRVRK